MQAISSRLQEAFLVGTLTGCCTNGCPLTRIVEECSNSNPGCSHDDTRAEDPEGSGEGKSLDFREQALAYLWNG